jgi:NodT family efflux transporter outer membrane factor (OMF) lipoprotein
MAVVRPLVLSVLVAAAGCRVHDVTHDPKPPLAIPDGWRVASGGAEAPDRWWTAFSDPGLDAAVERALAGNFDLKVAWARLDQIRAVGEQVGAFRLPEVTGTVSAGRQTNRFVLDEPIGEITVTSNNFSAAVAAGYEVDLWRRLDSGIAASELDTLAVRDSLEAIAMSIVAGVTETWLDIRYQKAQRALLNTQLEINQKSLELMESWFREGLGTALSVYQQRSLVSATRGRLINVESALLNLEAQLAVLIGGTLGDAQALTATAPETLPVAPPVPSAGVPASLLDRRPDIRALRRQVEAADHRVAVAVADRLPALRLSGQLSLSSSTIQDLIATPLYSIFAGITGPIFDYGRRKAEVARTRAVVEERLAAYGGAMVQAMIEVELALGQEQYAQAHLAESAVQTDVATAMVREAREAYREGQIDYLPVLTAVQSEQQVALSILTLQRALLTIRVSLYRALGGTWTATLEAPAKEGPR